ncbi:MAG TPA: DUF4157 domain-containing protein [Gemmatimonadaceae bacterium]|jgi:outer membrane protein OmpA-like peptidoglycan-associated protein|nr:DUF4157 domain-containing protein [Gemmatimonadaceae bacterium]
MKAAALRPTADRAPGRQGHAARTRAVPTEIQSQPIAFPPFEGAVLQRKCACGGGCPSCQNELRHPQIQLNQALSEGQSLPTRTRAYFEPRFGEDFSQVRIHNDRAAEDSARSVNALAYTVGRDVVFGSGQYAPETTDGRRLLAHELTHVVQQRTGAPAMIQRQEDEEAPEPPPTPVPERSQQSDAPKPPPNGITIDVLDPLNSSLRLGGFGLPSPRGVLKGLDKVRRLGQPSATDSPQLVWPRPEFTDEELREAACLTLPALCQKPQSPQPTIPQLQLPQFLPPRIVFHDNVTIDHFWYDAATISDRHLLTLDQKATEMLDEPAIVTDLTGHTDTRGPSDHNERLSKQRARSVRDYLLGRSVPPSQIWSVIGLGETRPKFSNDATDNLAASRNRRVEMEMRRLVWQWTLPGSFFLRPPRRANLSVTDPREHVLASDRPMFDQLRTFLVRVRGEITAALATGPVGSHKLTADNENVQAALSLLDKLIDDVQSEGHVVRFDQPTTSNVGASFTELEDLIHLRPFHNDQEMSQVAASLLHEYAHAIQDRTAEELLRARRLPLEHTRSDELRKETEARRFEVYFASLLTGTGHHLGFHEEVSAGVFVGTFERERSGSPAEQAAARREIRKELGSAYSASGQLTANAPTRRYLIEIRSGPSAVLIRQGGAETDLGSIPVTVKTPFQLDSHLAQRLETSPMFPSLFKGSGRTPNAIALFVAFDGDEKVAEFGLPRPTSP